MPMCIQNRNDIGIVVNCVNIIIKNNIDERIDGTFIYFLIRLCQNTPKYTFKIRHKTTKIEKNSNITSITGSIEFVGYLGLKHYIEALRLFVKWQIDI